MLETQEWSDLILDEAQNIKNPSAKQTQAIRRLTGNSRSHIEKGAITPPFRVALTGTPVENRLLELVEHHGVFESGLFGEAGAFSPAVCTSG